LLIQQAALLLKKHQRFQGTQIQVVKHLGSDSSYQLPVASCHVLMRFVSASSTGTVVMYGHLGFHLSQPCPLTGWSWAARPWPLFPVSPARTMEYLEPNSVRHRERVPAHRTGSTAADVDALRAASRSFPAGSDTVGVRTARGNGLD